MLLLLATIGVSIAILVKMKKCDQSSDSGKSEKYNKLKNPGCPVMEQAMCSQMGMADTCGGNCVPCVDSQGYAMDPEGSGCVPKSCAKSLRCGM